MSHGTDSARRRARELAFRLAYQADLTGDSHSAIWRAAQDDERLSDDQIELVGDVMRTLAERGPDVDAALQQAAEHWPLARLAATDRSVLRTSIAELMARAGTPARVVLDEAIEIARRYGSEESGRFVNGVLNKVAHQLRPAEF